MLSTNYLGLWNKMEVVLGLIANRVGKKGWEHDPVCRRQKTARAKEQRARARNERRRIQKELETVGSPFGEISFSRRGKKTRNREGRPAEEKKGSFCVSGAEPYAYAYGNLLE